ncbi:MAG TPA: hypothetical protein VJP77_09150, partial [Planctomycetota bacterium]|nr:hypothetical protein [Planctomycetota bacterium]
TTGVVQLGVDADVTGSTAPRSTPARLPEIVVPTAQLMADVVVAAGETLTQAPTVAQVGLVDVAAGSRFKLVGPSILIADNLRLKTGSSLIVDATNGPVWIYVKGRFVVDADVQFFNLQEDPRSFSVLVAGADPEPGVVGRPAVALNAKGPFHGQLYAPHAAVTVPTGLEVFGAVAAETLTLAPDAQVHYDQALLVGDGDGLGLELVSWRFVDPPRSVTANLRYDPITEFEQAGVTLERPADTHQAPELIVDYIGQDGETYRYKGEAADFDLTQVVTELARATVGDANYDELSEPLQLKLLQRLIGQ